MVRHLPFSAIQQLSKCVVIKFGYHTVFNVVKTGDTYSSYVASRDRFFLLIHPALNRIISIQDNAERARIVERSVRHVNRRKGHAGLRRLPVRSHGSARLLIVAPGSTPVAVLSRPRSGFEFPIHTRPESRMAGSR